MDVQDLGDHWGIWAYKARQYEPNLPMIMIGYPENCETNSLEELNFSI